VKCREVTVAAFVAGRFQGADRDGAPRCRGEVVIDLPAAAVADYVRDGIVEEVGPQRCRLILSSWSWPALAAAAGRFDAGFEVVGPPELSAACALLARWYAGAIRGSSSCK
jgi:hypothetical protein